MIKVDSEIKQAFERAKKARLGAFAPYSKFLVGVSTKAKNSDIWYDGCNIENASFGATMCAERVAIFKMISELGGDTKIEHMVLVTDSNPAASCCGLCLQVMAQFCEPTTKVYIGNLDGIQTIKEFQEMLYSPFSNF